MHVGGSGIQECSFVSDICSTYTADASITVIEPIQTKKYVKSEAYKYYLSYLGQYKFIRSTGIQIYIRNLYTEIIISYRRQYPLSIFFIKRALTKTIGVCDYILKDNKRIFVSFKETMLEIYYQSIELFQLVVSELFELLPYELYKQTWQQLQKITQPTIKPLSFEVMNQSPSRPSNLKFGQVMREEPKDIEEINNRADMLLRYYNARLSSITQGKNSKTKVKGPDALDTAGPSGLEWAGAGRAPVRKARTIRDITRFHFNKVKTIVNIFRRLYVMKIERYRLLVGYKRYLSQLVDDAVLGSVI